jgi:hypothetical protein
MEMIGKPRIYLQLSGGGAVRHVVDPWSRAPFDKLDDRSGGIVAVNLIDPACAFSFQNCFAGQKLAHEHRATGSVEGRKSRDQASRMPRYRFSFQQNAASLSVRSCFTGFINPRAVSLSVNGSAPRKEHLPGCKRVACISEALDIDQSVRLGCRLLRSGAMHQRINLAPGRLNGKRSDDVERADLVRLCREEWK